MIDLESTQESQPRTKKNLWPTILLAGMLFLSGIGIGYLVTSDGADEPATAEDATPLPGENGATEPASQDVPEVSLEPGDEPVADAAEIILPSVVQIQTGVGGVGSGVIYGSDGLILTAAHVVEGRDTVTVRFQDGEEVEGVVVGGVNGADVGVVQVDRTGLPAAELALGETPRVGQMAIAVGSPWGLEGTVTAGIISAVNQSLNCGGGGPCQSLLQTDAAINPGNSGGALVDRYGRLLGINVSIFTLSGANDGVGFAVPIDQAYDIATRLVAGETLETAYLGVTGSDVESGRAGALVTDVAPGTGADEAGIEEGDLVVAVDGVAVRGIADLAAQVRVHHPGDEVELTVVRDGEETIVLVTLGELPES